MHINQVEPNWQWKHVNADETYFSPGHCNILLEQKDTRSPKKKQIKYFPTLTTACDRVDESDQVVAVIESSLMCNLGAVLCQDKSEVVNRIKI